MEEGTLFEQVEDSRQDWKVKHSISEILMVVMCGVSAGERSIYGKSLRGVFKMSVLNAAAHFKPKFAFCKLSIICTFSLRCERA